MIKIVFLSLILLSSLFASSEYKIKAAYIYNIAKFVQWPEETFLAEDEPIKLGIYGDDPFGKYMDALEGKKVGKHPIQISRTRNIDEIDKFHILFISRSEASNMKQIKAKLDTNAILCISDIDNFLYEGGIIQLRVVKNRLKIKINMLSAKKHNLHFSAKLLEIASLVEIEEGL